MTENVVEFPHRFMTTEELVDVFGEPVHPVIGEIGELGGSAVEHDVKMAQQLLCLGLGTKGTETATDTLA